MKTGGCSILWKSKATGEFFFRYLSEQIKKMGDLR